MGGDGRSVDLPVVSALIAVTDGLEICTFPVMDVSTLEDMIEVNTAEVALSQDKDVYLVHRRIEKGRPVTWIGAYRKAFEIGRKRPGTYYGAGVWLNKRTLKPVGEQILAVLASLSGEIRRLALQEGQLVRPISSMRKEVRIKQALEKLESISRSLEPGDAPSVDKIAVEARGYVDASELAEEGIALSWLLDWALDDGSLFGQFSRVVIAVDPGAFAGGDRSSRPMKPHELRKLRIVREVDGRSTKLSPTSTPAMAPSYEERVQDEQEQRVLRRAAEQQRALSQNFSVDDFHPELRAHNRGHGRGIERQMRLHERVPWKRVVRLMYVCNALLLTILLVLIVMNSSLGEFARR